VRFFIQLFYIFPLSPEIQALDCLKITQPSMILRRVVPYKLTDLFGSANWFHHQGGWNVRKIYGTMLRNMPGNCHLHTRRRQNLLSNGTVWTTTRTGWMFKAFEFFYAVPHNTRSQISLENIKVFVSCYSRCSNWWPSAIQVSKRCTRDSVTSHSSLRFWTWLFSITLFLQGYTV
jgi:hypothetical protein